MARGGTQLFIGRLSKETTQRDLENVFYLYGKLSRCDIKYGRDRAYGFIEYEDARDAEEAMNRENNRKLFGSKIVVEYVRSKERGGPISTAGDECFKCGRMGHWRSNCTESRGSPPSRGSGRYGRSPPPFSRRPPPSGRFRSRSRSPRRFPDPPPRRRRSLSPPRRPRGPPPGSMSRIRDRYRR